MKHKKTTSYIETAYKYKGKLKSWRKPQLRPLRDDLRQGLRFIVFKLSNSLKRLKRWNKHRKPRFISISYGKFTLKLSLSTVVLLSAFGFVMSSSTKATADIPTKPSITLPKPLNPIAQSDLKAEEPMDTIQTEKPPVGLVNGSCGDNQYANYIYMHESGCNLNSVNAGGCRGIGQACPGSKLPCGADYACQNDYFTNYAIQRYGSWEAAYNFWLANHWW